MGFLGFETQTSNVGNILNFPNLQNFTNLQLYIAIEELLRDNEDMKHHHLPLYIKILIGMAAGILFGMLCVSLRLGHFVADWIAPIGDIFLTLLKVIAVPLVFVSLVNGISSLSDISRLSRMGIRTIIIYTMTTCIAILVGLGIVNFLQPGKAFPPEKRAMFEQYATDVASKGEAAIQASERGPLQFLVDLVPENIFAAASNNTNMLQIIVFALIFGIAVLMT